MSADKTLFYGHSRLLLAQSNNSFAGLLSPTALAAAPKSAGYTFIAVSERSSVFYLVMHGMYQMPCAQLEAATGEVLTALPALTKYGAAMQQLFAPGTPLLELATGHLAPAALQFYALAGKYGLHDLAVRASGFLLAAPLADLPPALVDTMGPVYLKRPIELQLGRQDALRALLDTPPDAHAPTPACAAAGQAALARAWKLVGAYFIWEMRPELTPIALDVALGHFREDIRCPFCLDAFNRRVALLLVGWARARRTI